MADAGADDFARAAQRLRAALDALAEADAELGRALARLGYPPPRVRAPGFATLLRIIVAQQLSTRAAAAIQSRLDALLDGRVEPEALLASSDAALRGCGLSARKVGYARELGRALVERRLDLASLEHASDETVVAALTALPGFGRWSAEIYLLFALQRLDVLPADDLALQVGFQRLRRLDGRPTGKALRAQTEGWAPWRGAAAIFLWHYYGAATLDDGG